jgi:WD40 repeat protein
MRLEGHSRGVQSLCVLPDGRLASAGADETIRFWNSTTGFESDLIPCQFGVGNALSLCVLPEGRLACSFAGGTIVVWDLAKNTQIARLEKQPGNINALQLLPNGRLASGSSNGTVVFWEPSKNFKLHRLFNNLGFVSDLCLSTEGLLVCSSGEGTICKLGSLQRRSRPVATTFESIQALCLLPDGSVASGHLTGEINIWDIARGAKIGHLRGHTDAVEALCVLNDGRLASGSRDKTIRLWDYRRGGTEAACLNGHSGWIATLCVTAEGTLASGGGDGTIRLWDVNRNIKNTSSREHFDLITALSVTSDGKLASADARGTVRVCDAAGAIAPTYLQAHTTTVEALCPLPDGRLASASLDQTIRVWDLNDYSETACFAGHERAVTALCILPDGRLASGAGDSTIRLWDVRRGIETGRLELGNYYVDRLNPDMSNWVKAVFVLPDGSLASTSSDHTVRLWDVTRCIETDRFRLVAGRQRVRSEFPSDSAAIMLPEGVLAVGYLAGHISLWKVDRGGLVGQLRGHTDRVNALGVVPDGRLISASHDRTIRVWDLDIGTEVCRLELDAPARRIAVLSDGRFVVADEIGRLHWLEIAD